MQNFHVSEDGTPRPCKAKTIAGCRAKGPNGAKAPHGQFESAEDAVKFAENVNEAAWATVAQESRLKKVAPRRSKTEDIHNAKAIAEYVAEDMADHSPGFDFKPLKYEAYLIAYKAMQEGENPTFAVERFYGKAMGL